LWQIFLFGRLCQGVVSFLSFCWDGFEATMWPIIDLVGLIGMKPKPFGLEMAFQQT